MSINLIKINSVWQPAGRMVAPAMLLSQPEFRCKCILITAIRAHLGVLFKISSTGRNNGGKTTAKQINSHRRAINLLHVNLIASRLVCYGILSILAAFALPFRVWSYWTGQSYGKTLDLLCKLRYLTLKYIVRALLFSVALKLFLRIKADLRLKNKENYSTSLPIFKLYHP